MQPYPGLVDEARGQYKHTHTHTHFHGKLPKLREIPPFFFCAKRAEYFDENLTIYLAGGAGNTHPHNAELARRDLLALLFLVQEGRATHANPRLSQHVETGLRYHFLCGRVGTTSQPKAELARGDWLALLFLAQEGQATHANPRLN